MLDAAIATTLTYGAEERLDHVKFKLYDTPPHVGAEVGRGEGMGVGVGLYVHLGIVVVEDGGRTTG